jgi:hypothetical protein
MSICTIIQGHSSDIPSKFRIYSYEIYKLDLFRVAIKPGII